MNITLELADKPELSQTQREHLEASLSTYAELKFDFDALAHLMEIEKVTIGAILEDEGVAKCSTPEFSLCWVRDSTTKKLDPKKLLAQGVTLAQIDAATVESPRKPYFQIRAKTVGKTEHRESPE